MVWLLMTWAVFAPNRPWREATLLPHRSQPLGLPFALRTRVMGPGDTTGFHRLEAPGRPSEAPSKCKVCRRPSS